MGTAKPMPTKKRWAVGLRIAVTIPTTSPRGGYQRPAGAAGISRGVELDEIGQHAFAIRRVELAPQSRDYSSTRRRTYAKRKADGDNLITYGKVRGGAHGRRDQIVGNLMRLKHGQIMLRLYTGHRGIGFEPVSKHHLHPLGAEHDMKIGQDHALVDDHDPGADAFFVPLRRSCSVPFDAPGRSTVE